MPPDMTAIEKGIGVLDFINNTWVVSLASIFIGAIASWLLGSSRDWYRSRRGYLTGSYLAYTENGDRSRVLVEAVRCRHVGRDLHGEITAKIIIFLDWDADSSEFQAQTGSVDAEYTFVGRQLERQVTISYSDKAKGSQNGGAIVMKLDVTGSVLSGSWVGTTVSGEIYSAHCIWVKDAVGDLSGMSDSEACGHAMEVLQSVDNPWLRNYPPMPQMPRSAEDENNPPADIS